MYASMMIIHTKKAGRLYCAVQSTVLCGVDCTVRLIHALVNAAV